MEKLLSLNQLGHSEKLAYVKRFVSIVVGAKDTLHIE